MTGSSITESRPFTFAVVLGVAGGAALALTMMLSKRGPMVFIAYAAMLAATLTYFRARHVAPYRRRFGVSFTIFMLSNLIATAYVLGWVISGVAQRPLWANVWPFLAMTAIGLAVSALVALAPVRRRIPAA
ncbi:MAG: hypothetical protein M3Q69_00555 [Acidobacteriota bacterium]|nr:hypothetical protein [Acidobacteriota bacterium]